MIPADVRDGLDAVRTPFQERRWLALCCGVAVGAAAVAVTAVLADAQFDENLAIALGIGGFAYYALHYEQLSPRGREPFQRGFVRNVAIISAVGVVTPDEATLEEALPRIVAVAAIVLLVAVSVAVDLRSRGDAEPESRDNE